MKRKTITQVIKAKAEGEKLTMITAYDATMARLVDLANVDIVLVGDSLGNVIQGHDTTLPVTIDEMIYHCKAVARGCHKAHLVGDMPFMSYQTSLEDGMRNAGRLMKEGNCQAVKLEGAGRHLPLIENLVESGIPVMGHIGLTPQSVHQFGGFKIQGRDDGGRERLVKQAKEIEAAGAYSLVLEGIPSVIAKDISAALTIPTIGIGAGPDCDGQVLVIYDLLGMDSRFKPKFVRRFAELEQTIVAAVETYCSEVKGGTFPNVDESFSHTSKAAKGLYSSPAKTDS